MMTVVLSVSALFAAVVMFAPEKQEPSTILFRVVNQRSTTEIYGMVAPAHQLWIDGEHVPVDALGGSFCYDTGTMQSGRILVLETLSPNGVVSRSETSLDVPCHPTESYPWIGRRGTRNRIEAGRETGANLT